MPTMASDAIQELENRLAQLRSALSQTVAMRQGSLVQRYTRCGKPSCHCAQSGDSGHGPFWSLTRAVAGKTITTRIPSAALEVTRAQIAEYKRFRALVRELVQTSERLCNARLVQGEAASKEAAKKGASQRRLRRKSSQRSKPS